MDTVERLAIVARNINLTNRGLLEAAAKFDLDAGVLAPEQALRRLRKGGCRSRPSGRSLDAGRPGNRSGRAATLGREGSARPESRRCPVRCARQARNRAHARGTRSSAPAHGLRRRGRRSTVRVARRREAALRELGRDITVCRSRFAFARCVGASSRPGVRLVSDSRGQAEPSAGLLSLRRVEQA
jgi:hypothetical protein